MMGEWDGAHPTDGTIHTWIDGELDAAESARLAAHMGECAECSARVAEARGLVAGASRVVGMLDASPALLVRPESQPIAQPIANTMASPRGSMWRTLRVTPARAAIAAVLIVAVGIALTRQNVAVDAGVRPSDTTLVALVAPKAAEVPPTAVAPRTAVAPEPAAAPTPSTTTDARQVAEAPGPRDTVLASAIARRLASDQPARTVGAAAGAGVPAAPASVGNIARMDTVAEREMMAGRTAARAAKETMGAGADRLAARTVSTVPADAGCYRIDPVDGMSSSWNGVPLPVDVALIATPGAPDASGGPRYAIVSMAGGSQIGAWSRAAGDTLSIALQGATVTTTGVLVSAGTAMTGVLRAAQRTNPVAAQLRASVMAAPSVGGSTVRVAAHRIACTR